MADDRSFIEANTREREPMRALAEGLDDDALEAPVNEYWTRRRRVRSHRVLDIRVPILAEKTDLGEPWRWETPSRRRLAQRPTRPLIHAIRLREAAESAVRIVGETDARVAELPLNRLHPHDPDSPIYAGRGEHRGEQLDEIEAALRARGTPFSG